MKRAKTSWLRGLIKILLLNIGIGSLFLAPPIKALEVSLWINTPDPTYTADPVSLLPNRPSNEFCTQRTLSVAIEINGLPSVTQANDCVIETNYGSLGRNFTILGQGNSALRLEAPGTPVLVPNSDYLTVTVASGFRGNFLRVFKNPITQFKKQASTSTWKISYKTTSLPDWQAVDNNNQPLLVNAIGASKNGQWLVFESSGKLFRLDLATFQFFAFTNAIPAYGIGLDPAVNVAISNDGRYAALGGINVNAMRMFDLSTCIPPTTTNSTNLATGCGQRDLTGFMQAKLPSYRNSTYFSFSADATSIDFYNTTTDVHALIYRVNLLAAGQTSQQLDYLALGDSFSSGEGDLSGDSYYLPGTDADSPPVVGVETYKEKCHLSSRSYPFLVAQNNSVSEDLFKSLACSGAIYEDILNTNTKNYIGHFDQLYSEPLRPTIKLEAVHNFTPGREAQIAFVAKYKPRAITLTMGGNDVGFGGKLTECATSVATCGLAGDPQERNANAVEIQDQFPALIQLYKKLHDASPETKIYVLGYPVFFGDQLECGPGAVLTDSVERFYINQSVKYMNTIIEAATKAAGVKYIKVENTFAGRELCSINQADEAVNGFVVGDDQWLIVGNESFHPNSLGHELMAKAIGFQVGNPVVFDACPDTTDSVCPTPQDLQPIPQEFAYGQQQTATPRITTLTTSPGVQKNSDIPMQFQVDTPQLMPGAQATFELHSSPITLGSATVDNNGHLSTSLTIPYSVPAGSHTLHVYVNAISGEKLDLYQSLTVLGPAGDVDEDGTPDTRDPCLFVPPSDIDHDRDGKDDACDGYIGEPPADSAPPTVTGTPDHQANEVGWYNNDVNITWSATDPEPSSGTPTTPPVTFANLEGTNTYISDASCDPLNNCATGSLSLSIDKTAPDIFNTISLNSNALGWYNTNVTVTPTCTDDTSGILSCGSAVTLTQDGTNQVVTNQAVDNAGNTAWAASVIHIDKTAPVLGIATWTNNPKSTNSSATLQIYATDNLSGIEKAEYYLGDIDPGQDNGATMTINGNTLTTTFGTDFPTGVYKVTVRAKDYAGNWSGSTSDYIVVYNPTGTQMTGRRTIVPSMGNGDILPGLNNTSQAQFGFNVRYDDQGSIHPHSDFQFKYKTSNSNLELNATSIAWLTTQGANNSTGIFQGTATLRINGLSSNVVFRLAGVDGERLSPTSQDYLTLKIYNSTDNPNTAQSIYQASGEVNRGNIKIRVE